MELDFLKPRVIETRLWPAAFAPLVDGLPAYVLGYQASPHALVWLDSVADGWLVHAYASFEEKFHSKYSRREPYIGGLMAVMYSMYLMALSVQYMPDLPAFDKMCDEVLHMSRVQESSTLRLLRKR
jgi:hypothetical protein